MPHASLTASMPISHSSNLTTGVCFRTAGRVGPQAGGLLVGGVATEDPVLAEQPEVSGLGGGFVRERRDLVRLG